MNNRRRSYLGLLLAAAMSAALLAGCRAFEPEAVVVNKQPETFIIGAPIESGGGYYHFHVFWYGSDEDGQVERFVWALTDTTLQDPDTVADEEDQNFNPALDASTLEIGHWTTKTDSIFNFTIDQGINRSADMTLHMVAVDDAGAFDRTPARLHFFSNTLGNPEIRFVRIEGDSAVPITPGFADTVGFGKPYHLGWLGESPNIRGYSSEALALVDTVYPFDDGLFGYKWQITGDLGGNCLASLEDCWHPRRFNEATGDSFSYFGPVTDLLFENNDSGTGPFQKLLPSGAVDMRVNSIDIAGVEVADFQRAFSFVVNFDPETILLNGETDWAHPSDPEVYPYYTMLSDPAQVHHPFVRGDRIPDRTYVVFKALARDSMKDLPLSGVDKPVGFTGFMQGRLSVFSGGDFNFSSGSSELNFAPTWGPGVDGWAADTLGFLTAPSTAFTMNMQSVDEHGRRDGSPDTLSFNVGYPPCVQCVELLPKVNSTSGVSPNIACADDPAVHPCFQDTTVLSITQTGSGPNDLQNAQPIFMLVDKQTYFVKLADSDVGQADKYYIIPSTLYRMSILLHSKDDARDAWSQTSLRSLGWKYQVDYDCDAFNQIKDGGGNDDILQPTWGQFDSQGTGLEIEQSSGLWRLVVDVAVPNNLFAGPDTYKIILVNTVTSDPEVAQRIFEATTIQYGNGTVRAVALDQTQRGSKPTRPSTYNYFRHVRPPVAFLPPSATSWRDANLNVDDIKNKWSLSMGAMASLDGEPVVKHFRLVVKTAAGDFTCEAQ